jgi:hypothetical protein
MTSELAHIARCMDLRGSDIVGAIAAREDTRALLAHLAAQSAPNTGVAKVLLVFAHMATTACDWIDGDLAIDLVAVGDATRVDVATELGGGLRERVFPPLLFQAPLEEFARAVDRVAHMIHPLRIGAKTPQRIALGASEITRRTSLPPPPIEISADSLFLRLGSPAVPRAREDDEAPASLPVVLAVPPAAQPASQRSGSDSPMRDLDSGWDD